MGCNGVKWREKIDEDSSPGVLIAIVRFQQRDMVRVAPHCKVTFDFILSREWSTNSGPQISDGTL